MMEWTRIAWKDRGGEECMGGGGERERESEDCILGREE